MYKATQSQSSENQQNNNDTTKSGSKSEGDDVTDVDFEEVKDDEK